MRSTSALLSGAAAVLALLALPVLAQAQEDRAPAPPPSGGGGAPSVDRGSSGASAGSPQYTPSGGSSGSGTSWGGSPPGRVDGSWRGGASTNPPGRGFSGGYVGGGNASPPPRVELPAPRLDPPGGGGYLRVGEPTMPPPGLMPRDPSPPRFTPPDQIRLEIPGFVGRPGGGGADIGLPEGPRLRAVELTDDQPLRGGRDDDQRILPPPDDGTVPPPVEDRKRPAPPPEPPVSPPSNGQPQYLPEDFILRRLGIWDPYYMYGWRSLWSEFGWWGRGCFVPYLSEQDQYWMRATGQYRWGNAYGWGAGCGYGYRGYGFGYAGYYGSGPYGNTYGYPWGYGYGWYPLGWYGSVYGYGSVSGYGISQSYLMVGNPCAVVDVETYSGRRYHLVAALPQLDGFGPIGLRSAIGRELKESGSVVIEGHGNEQLHLYAGFVKRLNTRWCDVVEW